MGTLNDYLTNDHRHCDNLFALAEESAGQGGTTTNTLSTFQALRQAMERHFVREEEILFPAFEQHGGSNGPTTVMRMEHAQMRELFEEMNEALVAGDNDGYLGRYETLLVMMQQHNLKEERILYPMTDRVLAEVATHLIGQMAAVA
ncbi:Hemerythrin domain-containing protein [Gammaproteobacteria bacterium]